MIDFPPDTYITHASKGRIRLRIPSKKRDVSYFDSLQSILSGVPGLDQIKVNPMSGSVLVLYSRLPDEVAPLVNAVTGQTSPKQTNGKPNSVIEMVRGTFQQINNQLKDFTRGEMDIPTLSFIALLAVGIYQITRKNFTAPAWYTAFWYALNIFLKLKNNHG